ncbi:MAG: redoxin domain-containing protein [Deltaproteobacteria bacterium]|jgi:peroxiredoxin|nr:redoxin domain-containing protein [Deltaproteobacteria bacterium]
MKTFRFLVTVFAVIFSIVSISGNSQAEPPKVGDEAPNFTVSSTLGHEIDYYRDYYGKHHLVLSFIANAFGPNCSDDIKGHGRVNYLYERLNTKVLVINRDDVETNRQFKEAHWFQFPFGSSVTARVGQVYGVYPNVVHHARPRFLRKTFVIDKAGIIRYTHGGVFGDVKGATPDYQEILNVLIDLEKEFQQNEKVGGQS